MSNITNAYKRIAGYADQFKGTAINIKQPDPTNQQGSFAKIMQSVNQATIPQNSIAASSAALEHVGTLRKWAKEKINKVKEADFAIKKAVSDRDFASGSVKVLAAINESEVALEEFLTVRNKLVSAYQAIMNMTI